MSRGPKPGSRPAGAPNPLAAAQAAWGAEMPDWVRALAQAVAASSQPVVARRLGMSQSIISQVLRDAYAGRLDRIALKVREILMPPPAPLPGRPDPMATAREHWGAAAPDWVIALAHACARDSQAAVAKRLGYTGGVISAVLRRKYQGDLGLVELKARGAFLGATIDCPIAGRIPVAECLGYQAMRFPAGNPNKVRVWGHCRRGCPHSRLKERFNEGQ